jgi:SAM-dependent methyltransferase
MLNSKVSSEYFQDLRTPLLSMVRGTPARVLEIGCAQGGNLAFLKSKGAKETVGVEIFEEVANKVNLSLVDKVIVGNIEEMDLPYPEGYFDLIIVSHVLEHLVDPWKILQKLTKFLTPDGQLIGGVPNIRNIRVSLPLVLTGKWQYDSSGIMDWTHLRFFTYATVCEMLQSPQLKIDSICPEMAGPNASFANKVTFGILKDFICYAYNFSCTKINIE